MTTIIIQSREAEEGTLGSVLIEPNCFFGIAQFLKPNHFYINRHKWIWQAFVSLNERRVPLDLITVTDELERVGHLNDIGGPAYLTTLCSQVPNSMNAEHYAHIVEGDSVRRDMLRVANEIAGLAYDETKAVQECVQEAVKRTAGLGALAGNNNLTPIGELFGHVFDSAQERSKDPKEVWGFATGLPKLDHKTGGLQEGELWYLAGRPGVGKSWLDLSLGMEFVKQAPGAIFSLEMKQLSVGRRLLSGVTGVSTRSLKSGFIKAEEWPVLAGAVAEYENVPLLVDDSQYDTGKLRATLAWAQKEYGIRWFILDYALLLMDVGRDETEQSKIISANMRRIVNDLNLGGVVLHSVTKVGMNGEEPEQGNQRGSGQAIHDCDLQLFLTEPHKRDTALSNMTDKELSKMATLWCSKGRELEESRFKIHLVRKGNSPFWGEYSETHFVPDNWSERKDLE